MRFNDKYIFDKMEDISLLYVEKITKEVLRDKSILDDLLQKHILEYNKILNNGCSSMSLKVMNQNYKEIFSTITPFEVVKSPHHARVSAKKDGKAACIVHHQFRTPTKISRISSKTERKRLSFDIAEVERMNPIQAFTEDSNEDQMHLNISTSFFKHDDEAKYYDSLEDRFDTDRISESVAFLHNQPAENTTKTPVKNETSVTTPEQKSKEEINSIIEEECKPWYLEKCTSVYRFNIDPDNNNIIQQRFNPEGKPETISSLAVYEGNIECLPTESSDNHQIMVTSPERKNSTPITYANLPTKFAENHHIMVNSPEEKNITPENYVNDGKKSARCLERSPLFFTSIEKEETSEKHTKNEESFQPNKKVKTVPSLPVTPLKTLCISSKTPEKTQTSALKANKKIKSINQNAVKITKSDDKENVSPAKDIKTPNTPKIKKRKFVDNYEKSVMSTNLVTSDQESVVTSKISKINGFAINNGNTTISSDISVKNDNDSICCTDKSLMDTSNDFHSADDSMDDNDSINRTDDGFIDDKDKYDDKSAMFAVSINNNSDNLCVISTKTPEKPTYEPPVTNNCVSPFTPELNQEKIPTDVKSNIRNPICNNNDISASEAKNVESLLDRKKDLSPSVQHSEFSPLHKSITNRSSGDCATLVRKLPLQENLSANIISGPECLILNESYTKKENMYSLEVKNFIKMLNQRKSRFSMYCHIFVKDKDELNFTRDYVEMLSVVVKKTKVNAKNEETLRAIDDFARKYVKIKYKADLWISDVYKDLGVWQKCIQKINQIEQDLNRYFREKKQVTIPNDFLKWKESCKMVNKTADDMILLREIRRPTIIQFGYEVHYLFQLFVQCLLLLGFLENSSEDSSDKSSE